MSARGSDPPPVLPPWLSIVALLAGLLAMGTGGAAAQGLGLRAALMAGEACLLAPAILLLLAHCKTASSLAFRPIDARGVALSLAAGLALWGASLGLMDLQVLVWKPPEAFLETFRRLHQSLRPRDVQDGVWSVTAIAIGPAVCEEVLFRGVLLPSFQRTRGAAGAVAVSSLLFGLIHVGFAPGLPPMFDRVPFAVMVGLGLGVLRLRTGSLWPPVLAHALLNALTFLVVFATDAATDPIEEGSLLLGSGLLLGAGSLFLMLVRLLSLTARNSDPTVNG